jgi:hypothetical protein
MPEGWGVTYPLLRWEERARERRLLAMFAA